MLASDEDDGRSHVQESRFSEVAIGYALVFTFMELSQCLRPIVTFIDNPAGVYERR